MKKNNLLIFFLSSFILINSVNANQTIDKYEKERNILKKNSLIKPKKYYKDMNKIDKNFAIKINPEFLSITGETKENFIKYAEEAANDKYWVEANKAFYFETRDAKIKNYNAKIPKYKKALKFFKESVKENKTILSAYQGLQLTVKYFTFISPDTSKGDFKDLLIRDILKKYLDYFSTFLMKKNYCYAYFQKIKFQVDYLNDYEAAKKTGDIGYPICKKQLEEGKIPKWLDKYFRMKYVKAKTILKLRNKR